LVFEKLFQLIMDYIQGHKQKNNLIIIYLKKKKRAQKYLTAPNTADKYGRQLYLKIRKKSLKIQSPKLEIISSINGMKESGTALVN